MIFRSQGKPFVRFLHTAKPHAAALVAGDGTVHTTLIPWPPGAYILRMLIKDEGLYVSILFQSQNLYLNT